MTLKKAGDIDASGKALHVMWGKPGETAEGAVEFGKLEYSCGVKEEARIVAELKPKVADLLKEVPYISVYSRVIILLETELVSAKGEEETSSWRHYLVKATILLAK